MTNKKPPEKQKPHEIELLQSIVDEFARFLVPEIRKYCDSKAGQREFAEWQDKQETKDTENE